MQVLSSLRSAKNRHRDCKVVRRKGRIYVICKSNRGLKQYREERKNASLCRDDWPGLPGLFYA